MASITIDNELAVTVEIGGEEVLLGMRPKGGDFVHRGLTKKESLKLAGLLVAAATGGSVTEALAKFIGEFGK